MSVGVPAQSVPTLPAGELQHVGVRVELVPDLVHQPISARRGLSDDGFVLE